VIDSELANRKIGLRTYYEGHGTLTMRTLTIKKLQP
jgi:hypothetical protein